MTDFIEIDGTQHPISFANAALILYERHYGRPMLGDFNKVVLAFDALTKGDFSQPYADTLASLTHIAIVNGYRERGEPCPITDSLEVAGILNDFETVSKIIIMMTDAMVQGAGGKGKKTTPPMKAAKRKAA